MWHFEILWATLWNSCFTEVHGEATELHRVKIKNLKRDFMRNFIILAIFIVAVENINASKWVEIQSIKHEPADIQLVNSSIDKTRS